MTSLEETSRRPPPPSTCFVDEHEENGKVGSRVGAHLSQVSGICQHPDRRTARTRLGCISSFMWHLLTHVLDSGYVVSCTGAKQTNWSRLCYPYCIDKKRKPGNEQLQQFFCSDTPFPLAHSPVGEVGSQTGESACAQHPYSTPPLPKFHGGHQVSES